MSRMGLNFGVIVMKKDVHPDYKVTTVTCACGNQFELGMTKENLRVEVCSSCHPFYTGSRTTQTAGGRIERFKKKHNLE